MGKAYVGRLRPNFFVLCDYHGYASATSDDDAMQKYLAATTPGKVGFIDLSLTQTSHCLEAHHSFPSGHASWSFGGLVFLGLCLNHIARSKGASVTTQALVF